MLKKVVYFIILCITTSLAIADRPHTFTTEQEEFLYQNPQTLGFLYQMLRQDSNFTKMQQEYSLSDDSIKIYKQELITSGLISEKDDNITYNFTDPYSSWSLGPILASTELDMRSIEKFTHRMRQNNKNSTDNIYINQLLLSESDYESFKNEVIPIFEKYMDISRANLPLPRESLEYVWGYFLTTAMPANEGKKIHMRFNDVTEHPSLQKK